MTNKIGDRLSIPHLTQKNLADTEYFEGIDQLRDCADLGTLIRGESAIHVIGSWILNCFKGDEMHFLDKFVAELNAVLSYETPVFQASKAIDDYARSVLVTFGRQRNVRLISSGWVELNQQNGDLADRLLCGVYQLSNGRRAVGFFRVM